MLIIVHEWASSGNSVPQSGSYGIGPLALSVFLLKKEIDLMKK
jgi:hypothetical protein